jgi:putative hydrolase
VSPEPPDVPPGDDQPNPFQGMPIFGDLARMFQQQGPVGWDAARQLALSVATDGGTEPNVDPMERIRIEPLARVAELHIGTASGLPASTSGNGISIVPVTRGQWATATLDAWRPLFESLAGALDDDSGADTTPDPNDPMAFMAPLLQMIGPMMLGMTAGSMVGHLARRSFGQYDLPIPRTPSDELMVVPANLDEFGREWSLPADDLRLWICLQEVAVHTVLRIPHVRAALDDLLGRYVTGFRPDAGALEDRLGDIDISDPSSMSGIQSLFGDPQLLLGAIQSPEQREMLPRFEALVSAIAGYVDHIVDVAGQKLLQNHGMLSEAVRRRRVEADPSDRFVERLFGLELTQAAYDRGSSFVAGVLERAGDDGLARLWEAERTLPTPAEIDAPGLWLARIELPDD